MRYEKNQFSPCPFYKWQLNEESYAAVLKATDLNRENRFRTISEFLTAWKKALITEEFYIN